MTPKTAKKNSYDCLSSGKAFLFNVAVEEGRLYCGAAYFESGLGETVTVSNHDGTSFEIVVPERARNTLTYALMTDKRDRMEFTIIGQSKQLD